MKIQSPVAEPKKYPYRGPILVVLILISIGAFAWVWLTTPSPDPKAVLTIQSFAGDVQISETGVKWAKPVYGSVVKPQTFIRAGEDGELDLQYNEGAYLRLKQNSKIQYTSPSRYTIATGRIHLMEGRLIVANITEQLQVTTAAKPGAAAKRHLIHDLMTRFINIFPQSYLAITLTDKNAVTIGSARGTIKIESRYPRYSSVLADAEMSQVRETDFKKSKISQDEWKVAREAYELKPKSAATEAIQLDLAKKAGNFFEFVLDHGTFYQKNYGWCEREFFAKEGEPVYSEITYDVFPKGSWVGVYFKTRDLDLAHYKTLKFEARRIPGRPHPDFARIELKSKAAVVQAYVIKRIAKEWEYIEFPIHLSQETPASEMTFIFTHEKVGVEKSGGIQIRNVTLVKDEERAKRIIEEAKTAAAAKTLKGSKAPIQIGINQSAITKGFTPAPKTAAAPAPAPVKEEEILSEDLTGF